MVAERAIDAGEELSHLYALCPSAELLANYGFVPKGGTGGFEAATIDVPSKDVVEGPGGAERLKALEERGLARGARLSRPILLRLFGNVGSSLLLPVARLCQLRSAQEVLASAPKILDAWEELPAEEEREACFLAGAWLGHYVARAQRFLEALEQSPEANGAIGQEAIKLILAEGTLIQDAQEWLAARAAKLAGASAR